MRLRRNGEKMYNFFVEPSQIQGNEVRITGSDVNHIKNVLRMRVGEELSVSNGVDSKEYRCGIEGSPPGFKFAIMIGVRFISTSARIFATTISKHS